jgi:hypothetical protein
MKRHLTLIFITTFCALNAYGQGSVLFNNVYFQGNPSAPPAPVAINTIPGMSNPADGIAGAYVGSNYTASLLYVEGTVSSQSVFDSLTPSWAADASFYGTTGLAPDHGPGVDGAGLFDGGQMILRTTLGARVTIQVITWYNGGGLFSSYSQALAAGQNTGRSLLVPIVLGYPPGPAATLDGLLPFTVGIPEPSTIVLTGLGGAVLLLFHRRK